MKRNIHILDRITFSIKELKCLEFRLYVFKVSYNVGYNNFLSAYLGTALNIFEQTKVHATINDIIFLIRQQKVGVIEIFQLP